MPPNKPPVLKYRPNRQNDDYIDDGVITYQETSETMRKRLFALLALCGAGAIAGIAYLKNHQAPSFSAEQLEAAKTQKNEMLGEERGLMERHGGNLYSLRRLPGAERPDPTAIGNVYVKIPESPSSRLLIFLHGGGGFKFAKNDGAIENIVSCAEALNLPIMAPQDTGKGWRYLSSPSFLSDLVEFGESQMSRSASSITLSSFSSGNVGVMNILKSLETSEDSDAKSLYKRIDRVVFFDSADGTGNKEVARWMSDNSDTSLFSCYNENAGGVRGAWNNGNLTYKAGNDLLRQALENEGIDSSRIVIEEIPKKKTQGHGVNTEKCPEYLK